jgi:cell division protein FtsW
MPRADKTGTAIDSPKRRRTSGVLEGPRDIVVPRLLLIVVVFVLTIIGLVMVFSSSSIEALNEGASSTSYLSKQLMLAAISIIACTVIAKFIPYYVWMGRFLDLVWAGSLVLLLLTALIGTVGLGAQRWLALGPISFQPSEFAKVAFVLMMARIMYQARTEGLEFNAIAIRTGIFVIAPLLLLYASQSDLGTTLICAVGLVAVLWLADVPWKAFVVVLAGLALFAIVAICFVGYRSDRMAFLNPEADYYGSGYQLIRSFYAFGEGGLFGVGLGNSTEKYLYLPEAETDFIFSIIGEELGLVGALIVVALFILILYAGLRIAKNAPDLFGTMIAGGCTIMLVFQAFLNIGCVLGMLPTTGKPLPFISSGGSSLIGSFLLVGVILSVSFASGDESGIYDRRRADLKVVRAEVPARRSGNLDVPESARPRRDAGGRRSEVRRMTAGSSRRQNEDPSRDRGPASRSKRR